VHFARTVQEAREHAAAGRCVAVDVVLVRTPNDLDPPSDRRPMLAGVIAPPSSWSPHDTAPPTGRT
jgi:hypothetical protein